MADWIGIVGTIAFAISGYLVAARKQLDLLGVIILALLTAIGGGMIRDTLVSRLPLVFSDNTPIIVIALSITAAWALQLHRRDEASSGKVFVIADSLGLVAFSVIGAQVGLDLNLNLFGVVALGFVTAVGGGMVRDILVNEIPFILNQDFYGTVAIITALGMYGLHHLDWLNHFSTYLLLIFALAIRLGAYWRQFKLPKVL